jgi:hypothetical protein
VFYHVYNNTNWNVSVRLINNKSPYAGFISGSSAENYTVLFNGYNILGNRVLEEFSLSSSISNATANALLKNNKRFYVGSEYTNFTGSVINRTDKSC